ncbi:hypothetical protein GCM10009808_02710 [Microbacterium sediminicola]|uniref:Membrane protein 6-pyruvoyl-tetrahydropterin synthase-related domain-containing protein n=1 Tax=Microbacterium sediminicola TaxID=415210 RepID=A0ABP4TLF5_9MICO
MTEMRGARPVARDGRARTERRSRRHSTWIWSTLGIGLSLAFVACWLPPELWTLPIQGPDALAHYQFIRELFDDAGQGAMSLWPGGSYYPPLFHLLAAGVIGAAQLVGLQISVFTAFALVWVLIAGLVFPLGVLLFTRLLVAPRAPTEDAALGLLVPMLAVLSVAHPYQQLVAGPLLTFGFGMSLVPLLLWVSLSAVRALREKTHSEAAWWLALSVSLILVLLLAHPRALIPYALLLSAFLLFQLRSRGLLLVGGLIVLGGLAFSAYSLLVIRSDKFLHPETWFAQHPATQTLGEAAFFVLSGGTGSWAFALPAAAGVVALIAIPGALWRERYGLAIAFLGVLVLYTLTVAADGAFANIATSPWYRDENRVMMMVPIVAIPALVTGCVLVMRWLSGAWRGVGIGILLLCGAVLLLSSSASSDVRERVAQNASLAQKTADSLLSEQKLEAFEAIATAVGEDGLVVSDPMNGSPLLYPIEGIETFYPIINPPFVGAGQIYTDIVGAFASHDPAVMETALCALNPQGDVYFLEMGPQSPEVIAYQYRGVYAPFHDLGALTTYVETGALVPVAGDESLWELYRVTCAG